MMVNVDPDVGRRAPGLTGPDYRLQELFEAQYRPLVRLAALLVDDVDSAEDVVQESFVRLHASWHTLRDDAAAPAWLRSTVLNLARSGLRRRQVARRLHLVPQPNERSAEAGALLADDRRAVLDALATLPRRQREVLVLRYWADCSEAEIATTLAISTGAVKGYAHRGIARLRDALEDRR